MTYDSNNIFAKILRGDIPCKKIFENEYALAFPDIAPNAPTHVLVIPKGEYISFDHFMKNAAPDIVHGYFAAVQHVAQQLGVADNFRLITNNGEGAGQSVHHFHMHILAGKKLGPLLAH